MDIDGAKALKERLGRRGAVKSPPAPVEVPEDAPPVYHWLGIGKSPTDTAPAPKDDTPADDRASWFARAGLRSRPAGR